MEPITFDTPGRVELDLHIPSGEIRVETADIATTTVEIGGERDPDAVRVELSETSEGGHRVSVRQRERRHHSVRVRVVTRDGAHLRSETGSADLTARGRLGSLSHRSGSGDLAFGRVDGDIVLKVASGDVRGEMVGGGLSVDSASGDVQIGSVGGDLSAHLASGDLRVGSVGGSAKATSASGDISVGAVSWGSASLTSMSGDITVGVRPGTQVWLDLSTVSGSAASELDPVEVPAPPPPPDPGAAPSEGPVLELRASSVSGDVRVTRTSET